MPVIRVFLVDDHDVVREGLKHMLASEEDIQVVGEAASGEDAVVQAQQLQPDIVLMDIKMPGMDGITATRKMQEKIPDIRVVMLTLYDHEYVTQAIEAGAWGYVLKEASCEQLIKAIRDAHRGYAPLAPSLTRDVLNKLADSNRANRDSRLSERQCQILKLVAAGLANKNIGDKLYLSEATVKKDLTYIFSELGANDRAQAVSEAMKQNLI